MIIQLNDQAVLFLTIQFSLSYLFALILNIKQFDLTYQLLPLQVRVDLGTMAMKGYSTFSKTSNTGASQSDCLMSYLGNSLGEVLPINRDTVYIFYCLSCLDWKGHNFKQHSKFAIIEITKKKSESFFYWENKNCIFSIDETSPKRTCKIQSKCERVFVMTSLFFFHSTN